MSTSLKILLQIEGMIGRITLNRPDKKNPLTFESYAELRDLFRDLAFKLGQVIHVDGGLTL